MALGPTAFQITVSEVLAKLEGDFEPVATAVENGEFALWVGSGISRQAPNLGNLIESAFDYIRVRAIDLATSADFLPALEEALRLAEIDPATVTDRYNNPLAAWPEHDDIIKRLWNKYSRVLDIPIKGKPSDYVLWEAIDVRKAFENPQPPAAEHLCIAILMLEAAVQSVASANWDGFIEEAVQRLSNDVPGVMQVVVDPDQLRGPAGRARLLKFHGCIIHATREPNVFRQYLTGSYTQIMTWPETAAFAAIRNAVVGLATNQKTLVLGLSIQDNNLQTLFTRAKEVHAWPWPCAPDSPAYIFCEDSIQQGQRDVLRLCYGAGYNADPEAVHGATLLRAWGEKVLIAMVLKLLGDKLSKLMSLALEPLNKGQIAIDLNQYLRSWRDQIADQAEPPAGVNNRTDLVNRGILLWSRMLSMYRSGALPANLESYETLTTSTPVLIAADPNAQATGLGRLGVALSLLEYGRGAGHWDLMGPASNDSVAGAMAARSTRAGAVDRPLFIVKSATEAIALKSKGAFANDDAIVLHADDAWHSMGVSSGSARRMRTSPGRTGYVGETHISLGKLIERHDNATALQAAFLREMVL